jgi:hypothetical protein
VPVPVKVGPPVPEIPLVMVQGSDVTSSTPPPARVSSSPLVIALMLLIWRDFLTFG